MKMKLTTLLFGLLLAVGWTNAAHAQKLPDRSLADEYTVVDEIALEHEQWGIDDESMDVPLAHSHAARPVKKVKKSNAGNRLNAPARAGQELDMKSVTKAQADAWTYNWTDASNASHTSTFSEVAKDPYQMYELLRQVYMDKRFPGPTYSAYTMNDERERKVYYGAIGGGWEIPGTVTSSTVTVQKPNYNDIVITTTSGYVGLVAISVYANGIEMQSWTASENNPELPSTWQTSKDINYNGESLDYGIYMSQGGTITIPASLIQGKRDVQVIVRARKDADSNSGTLSVGGTATTSTLTAEATSYSWRISPTSYTSQTVYGKNAIGDINITGSNRNAAIQSITVKSGSTTLFSWSYAVNGTSRPYGMSADITYNSSYQYIAFHSSYYSPFVLYSWLFDNYSQVTVSITAFNRQTTSGAAASLIVNGVEKTISTSYGSSNPTTLTWTVDAKPFAHTDYDPDQYKPNEEGYTALIVAVKNSTSNAGVHREPGIDNTWFETKQELINYLANNIDSIQLLTDGLRIGSGSDYSIGTVFNCEGTYNKFFFLGKGQARQKADVVRSAEVYQEHFLGELVPFKEMFEQFSPTGTASGDQTDNFYSKMMEGNVYNVVHDCRAVIGLGHQFSMSGNNGTKAYAMTGMNFFIPDYRLKYWSDTYTYSSTDYNVDGRIINPYQTESTDGDPVLNKSLGFRNPSRLAVWYGQYNQNYAPRVGLYKITLDAVATPVAYDHTEGNLNYAVTLTWVSSLNEMTGHDVEQIYTVYYWDPVTGEKKYVEAIGITDGQTGLTTVTYLVEQLPHSYKIEYIVEGHPTADTHSHMVAVSNIDDVVIPGWEDFVGLQLDHHESDFVVGDMANWYRNFLVVVNEDIANGLTVDQITDPENPMNEFKLYRFEYDENDQPINSKPIATVRFSNPTAEQVEYEIIYDGVNVQQQYEPEGDVDKYDLDENHLDVPLTGVIRLKGNGDIVIWPNGYHVNFKSIVIKNNGVAIPGYSWDAETMNTLPTGWEMSSGSKWEEYTTTNTGDKVGYVEGGGYIYIPNMLNNSSYTNLTVEIVAYGDGANVTRIAVNDKSKLIANTPGVTYTWGTNDAPLSPAAAPRRDNTNNNSNN